VREAIEAGADLKDQDKYGTTKLMAAPQVNYNPEVITALLNAGADGKPKDLDEETALGYAHDNDWQKGTDAYRQLQKVSK
jgi:ankyrin repeat protein